MEKRFTIIELLVVISIIAILTTILLPALSKAKQSAKELECVNNLKQSGLSIQMYANDNNDYAFLYSSSPEKGWHEPLYDGNYLKNRDTSLCPSWTPEKYTKKWYTYGIENGLDLSGYPLVRDSSNTTRFRNFVNLALPSQRISLTDSIWTLLNANYPYQAWVIQTDPSTVCGVHLRHNKLANALFWDLHARKSGINDLKNAGFSKAFELNGNITLF